ncbi:MAG: ATP-binding protein [Candidatus Omnitrophota bacterium]
MNKRIRSRVSWKLTGLVSAVGIFFLAAVMIIIYSNYRNFFYSEANVWADSRARFASERIEDEIKAMELHLSFIASHNQAIIKTVEAANAEHAGVSEEENLRRMKNMDIDWAVSGWPRLKDSLLNNDVSEVLGDIQKSKKSILSEIFITDRSGALIATTNKTSDYFQADEKWWQRSYNNGLGAVYTTAMEWDENSNSYGFSIACPIIGAEAEVIGIMKVVIDENLLFRDIFEVFFNEEWHAGVMSQSGSPVFTFSVDHKDPPDIIKTVFNSIVLKKGRGSRLVCDSEGKYYFLGYSKLQKSTFFAQEDSYVYSLLEAYRIIGKLKVIVIRMFFIWAIVSLFLCFAIFFISRKIVFPLLTFQDGFALVNKGVFDKPIVINTGDEFESLSFEFNKMLENLRNSTISKDYFDEIIQNMSDALFIVDPYGAIGLVNKRACALLGYEEKELKGKEAIQVFSKKDRYIVSWGLKGLIEEGALKDKKVNLLTKSGKETEVYLGTRSLRNRENNLTGLVCMAIDLTDINKLLDDLKSSVEEASRHKQDLEKALKEQLEARDVILSILEDTDESKKVLGAALMKLKETQDELLQAEKMISLGQIAAGVAHEINNPLFVISGEAEMLSMEPDSPPSAAESVKIIREQVGRIGDIIKRLLEFSRKKETKFVPLDINVLMDKVAELLKYQVKLLAHIEIDKKISNEKLTAKGDQNQLQEVFFNFMINAVQAMEEKGGILTIRTFSEIIKPKGAEQAGNLKAESHVVVVQISDTGIGMNEETQKRIFDPFFTTKKTGTGLGLSICFGIIESHGGSIEVNSQLGIGTMFTVKLPLVK